MKLQLQIPPAVQFVCSFRTTFSHYCLYSGNATSYRFELTRFGQLADTLLESEIEGLPLKFLQFTLEAIHTHFSHLSCVHQIAVLQTNVVCTGSFAAARRKASRARLSSTPCISYNMRPGCTFATQYSTLPFPFPCRTSSGFFVIGLSGNIRIQIFAPRFTFLVIARRAASI